MAALSVGLTLQANATSAEDARPAPVQASGDAGTPILIHAEDGETFTPLVGDPPAGVLSADDAYRTSMGGGEPHYPDDHQIRLGRLTLPVGNGDAKVIDDQLVYAYDWQQCGPRFLSPESYGDGATPDADTELADLYCHQWYFVDARTGEMLDLTWSK